MSVSFYWEVVKPGQARAFNNGTSSDIAALLNTFGQDICTTDIPKLRAMHAATHLNASLWSDIADALERLQGDADDAEIKIRVWTEF